LRDLALGPRTSAVALALLGLLGQCLATGQASAATGRGSGGAAWVEPPAGNGASAPFQPTSLPTAELAVDGRTAIPPASAPEPVRNAIYAANRITRKPYRYGGGHRRWRDRGYDCSGAVSFALHGGGLLARPFSSGRLMRWGMRGRGRWVTVYANRGHAYVVIAGLRFDTSGRGERGPRWRMEARSSRAYVARHPNGL
jgi:cell wall-associated NlpC family hydrolase